MNDEKDLEVAHRLEPRLVDPIPLLIASILTIQSFASPFAASNLFPGATKNGNAASIGDRHATKWATSWSEQLNQYAFVFLWLLCFRMFWVRPVLARTGLATAGHALWLVALATSIYFRTDILNQVAIVPLMWWTHIIANNTIVFIANRVAQINEEPVYLVLERWYEQMDADMQTVENQLLLGFFIPLVCTCSLKTSLYLLGMALMGFVAHKAQYRQFSWLYVLMLALPLGWFASLISMSRDAILMAFSLGM